MLITLKQTCNTKQFYRGSVGYEPVALPIRASALSVDSSRGLIGREVLQFGKGPVSDPARSC